MNIGTVTWDSVPGALAYRVEYKRSADPSYILYNSFYVGLSINIPGLDHNTYYDFSITSICTSGESTPSIITGLTPCGKITFDYATTTVVVGSPTASLVVNWLLTDIGIDNLEIKWKLNSDPFYGPAILTPYAPGSYTITGLNYCMNYDISITTNCGLIVGDELVVQQFTAANACEKFGIEVWNTAWPDINVTDLFQSPSPLSRFHYIPEITPGNYKHTDHNYFDFPLFNYDLHLNNTGLTSYSVYLEMIRGFLLVNTTLPIIVPPGISTVSIMLMPGPVMALEQLRINLKLVGQPVWPFDPIPPPPPFG